MLMVISRFGDYRRNVLFVFSKFFIVNVFLIREREIFRRNLQGLFVRSSC